MKRVIQLYKNAYSGLSPAAWMLALVMFINRSGSMVLPFLSVYLTESLHYDLKKTGLVMSIFGLGSMVGAFLGGWLTDKIGHFRVQIFSLILGGFTFFLVADLSEFFWLAPGIFLLSLITETFRPANASSVSYYTKSENITRAFSLNRMALNLGFSIGPAVGGILAAISFKWLFIADGITCISAGLLFFFYFKNKEGSKPPAKKEKHQTEKVKSPFQDVPFVFFILLTTCFTIVFFQLFTTLPLYYRDVYHLTETRIGGLLGLNGLIVFLLEMIVVYILGKRVAIGKLIVMGVALVGVSYMLLNLSPGTFILYFSMLMISISEILAMPFMATITVQRSNDQNRGAYMGMYTFAYATAFVLAPYLGTTVIDIFGYATLWWGTGLVASLTAFGFFLVMKQFKPEPVGLNKGSGNNTG
ncbi:MAG: MFS transporter [Candidatus Cyclobacteriaceae bacterium M3_2C_046]